eukprot:gene4152-4561_t
MDFTAEAHFTTVYNTLFKRCFTSIGGETIHWLSTAWGAEPVGAGAVVAELRQLGLWLTDENCLTSLLLQYTIINKFGPRPCFVLDASYENFGALLVHALKYLGQETFEQYSSIMPHQRERWEDGVGLFIGCALPNPGRRRAASVDYYLNHTLDMFLELTLNGKLLVEHFERFRQTICHTAHRAVRHELPCHWQMFEHCRYTYVVKRIALFRGTELFHHPVRSLTM